MDSKKAAAFLVQYFNSVGEPLTNLKLQKILYYLQVWYLVHFKGKLIFTEVPKAWVHGPVYSTVYNEYKGCGGMPIIPNKPWTDREIRAELEEIFPTKKEQEFAIDLLKYYGSKNAFILELMTHNEEPWQRARMGLSPIQPSQNPIDLDFAKNYYKSLLSAK